ncbi:hypothetical protein A9798_11360 [Edwardsiella hoshinae]|uniref:Transposase IS204/IS1001/IS1096/IS1165 DDE domain-containing protein n=1 Tax=Edwardsiella hoshinae TaxID=93378 RepID=A0ABM6EK88_9GAMM|nr:hypothetical protein A9798_11360 [Edwardsiella hoshinae]
MDDCGNLHPLVLLPGRDQRTLTAWFRKYPKIQVVSRDRGGIHATAAREGTSQSRSVADRWHLLKNMGDVLERMMYRDMSLIRFVANALSPKKSPEPERVEPAPYIVARSELSSRLVINATNVGSR